MASSGSSGIIAGENPLKYSSGAPYTLFIFQMIVIVVFSEVLHYPLAKLKQPRVISEVLAGIILGPTALGKIPNFTNTLFPSESMAGLSLVSTLGICLLLFMVGCEVDIRFIKKHLLTALSVGLFNMAVPFGLGCAFSVSLWKEYRLNQPGLPVIKFTTFMVFIGVSMCITAFPVLARILTELRLVKDRVGVVVLAAGITNDLLGWILLALSITLANSSKPQITGYIVIVTIAWALLICYPFRWVLRWFLQNKLHDLDNPNGPSPMAMFIILIMMFASAFFTDIIGVHPIFGAFMIGTIVPRDNNYVIRLTERIEDLVNIILCPLYFGIAGLNADLTLLNKGIDWAYVVGLLAIALFGKIIGGTLPARMHGLFWRESLAVGVLMSCKGIVEIVVLQTGLKAGIVSKKIFAMFILMALISTFLTTPLTLLVYPESYRESVQRKLNEKRNSDGSTSSSTETNSRNNDISSDSNVAAFSPGKREQSPSDSVKFAKLSKKYSRIRFDKLILPVDSLESVSNNLILVDRFCKPGGIPMHAVNIKELTDRTADLLHASMMHEMDGHVDQFDGHFLNAILSILKIFCDLNGVPFTSEITFTMPGSMLRSLLLNQNLLSNDLLILTVRSKVFVTQPKILDAVAKIVGDTHYYCAVFINNNQDIGKLADVEASPLTTQNSVLSHLPKEYLEEESLLSNETILNPKSFQISNVSLITNPGKCTSEQLVALKLFSILVSDQDVSDGYIISCQTHCPDYYHFFVSDASSACTSKVKATYYEAEEEGNQLTTSSYEGFVLSLVTSRSQNDIDELVIVARTCPFLDVLIKKLVKCNRKVLVVF